MIRSMFVSMLCLFIMTHAHAANPEASAPTAGTPKRAILMVIDGLAVDTLQKASVPNLKKLAAEGSVIQNVHVLVPDQPTKGSYARLHESTIPNVSLLVGNFFIKPDSKFVQQQFYDWRKWVTVNGVDEYSYQSLDRFFNISLQNYLVNDVQLLAWGAKTLRENNVRFMLLHLQQLGGSGWRCARPGNEPWSRNIWGEGSPYIQHLGVVDEALGKFVEELKAAGQWDDTLLIVTADHGQALKGGHPAIALDSCVTTAIVTGPGVKKGFTTNLADQIDLAPTICSILGVEPPNPGEGCGLVINEIKVGQPDTPSRTKSWTDTYNRQHREYIELSAKAAELALQDEQTWWGLVVNLRDGFYSINDIMSWSDQKTVDGFLAHNQQVLDRAKDRIKNPNAPRR